MLLRNNPWRVRLQSLQLRHDPIGRTVTFPTRRDVNAFDKLTISPFSCYTCCPKKCLRSLICWDGALILALQKSAPEMGTQHVLHLFVCPDELIKIEMKRLSSIPGFSHLLKAGIYRGDSSRSNAEMVLQRSTTTCGGTSV